MDTSLFFPDHLVAAGVFNDIMVYSFRTLFFLSAVLLMAIVLLQEGKGGGLASALGGQGAETFGVSTGGVNKVTLFLAGLFLASALGHALAFEQSVTGELKHAKKASTGGAGTADEQMKKLIEDTVKDAAKEPVKEPEKEPAKDPVKEPEKPPK
jgi:protein translocase SecG subunit